MSAFLAACGGGGSGGSPVVSGGTVGGNPTPIASQTPSGGASSQPTASPTPTFSPSPTPSPTVAPSVGVTAVGRIVDDNGAGIANATVVISNTRFTGPTPPPGSTAPTAVTNADGTFTVSGLAIGTVFLKAPGNSYVHVFGGPGRPVFHALLPISAGANQLGSIRLTMLTATELAWLNDPVHGINADRAANGVGPVFFDEYIVEEARFWAKYEAAHAYQGHTCPTTDASCVDTFTYSSAKPGYFSGGAQNLAEEGSSTNWAAAESAFLSEKANCPNGVAVNCPASETTGHFLNLVDPTFVGVGLGIVNDGTGGNNSISYYVQEFGG
jgi:uncharacterized protein YkwD